MPITNGRVDAWAYRHGERTLMPPRGGVNRRDDQIKLFPRKLELHGLRRLDRHYQAVRPPLLC
jgi:hypothetical protein